MSNPDVKRIARELAGYGDRKDKILAHLTVPQAALLARRAGGTVNKVTGLAQFGFLDSLGGGLGGLLGSSGDSNAGQTSYSELTQQAQPILDAGKSQLNQFSSGQLNSADASSLASSSNAAKSYLNQYYASAGLGNSSMLANQKGNVDMQTAQGRQQILNGYLSSANQLYGTGLGAYEAAVSSQYNGNVAAQSSLSSGLSSIFGGLGSSGLGSLFGSGSSGSSSAGGIGGFFSGLFGSGSSAGVSNTPYTGGADVLDSI